MKQQAHGSKISCLSYSSDSMYIATGSEDGKVFILNLVDISVIIIGIFR